MQRSIENMVIYYQNQLIELLSGKSIVNVVPKGTREILMQFGVLIRFGSKYELTEHGKELLRKHTLMDI